MLPVKIRILPAKYYFHINKWEIWCRPTHDTPTKNRATSHNVILVMKADTNADKKAKNDAYRITFNRPHVSAKKPHICDEQTMPKNGMDENKPDSLTVICNSQSAYGRMMLALIFSRVAPTIIEPHDRNVIMWKSPNSKQNYTALEWTLTFMSHMI